jgi:aryl-alcohol dehydrogenase-like predicted oxidoreductase
MRTRRIGETQVSAIGLGGMPLSIDGRPDRERAVATIHAALDAGINFIDTADAYSLDDSDFGHNESLIASALAAYGGDTSDVLVATKGGHTRLPGGGWDVNGSPAYLRKACESSLKNLGVEAIGLY